MPQTGTNVVLVLVRDADRAYSLTARDAADVLGVHVETVKRWIREGKVPARKNISGVWLLNETDVDELPVHVVRD